MIAWGAVGTWVEISNPRFGILTNYEEIEIGRMKGAAIATTIEHVLLPIIRFAIHFASTYNLLEKEEPAENLPGFWLIYLSAKVENVALFIPHFYRIIYHELVEVNLTYNL